MTTSSSPPTSMSHTVLIWPKHATSEDPPPPPQDALLVGENPQLDLQPPSSPPFATASLWVGCLERCFEDAERRAARIARENEESRSEVMKKLNEAIRLCRQATMNITYALNPPDKLADELGCKMRIVEPTRTDHPHYHHHGGVGQSSPPRCVTTVGLQRRKAIEKASQVAARAGGGLPRSGGNCRGGGPGALARFLTEMEQSLADDSTLGDSEQEAHVDNLNSPRDIPDYHLYAQAATFPTNLIDQEQIMLPDHHHAVMEMDQHQGMGNLL